MLGYEPGEISDSREAFLEIVHPDDVELLEELQQNHIENGAPMDFELRIRHKLGRWVHIRSRGHMIPNENGDP